MSKEMRVKEISELMDVANEKIPELINRIVHAVYSPEAAREFGKAVGAFYGGLIEGGIPTEAALEMAKDYASSLKDVTGRANMVGRFGPMRRRWHPPGGHPWGAEDRPGK